MTAFFDHQIFSQQLYGGISRYFCELITGINQTDNQAHLSLLYSNNIHLREYGLKVSPYYLPKKRRFLNITNQYYNLIDLAFNDYDIYHATYFDPFFINRIGSKPYVVTYYDMIHEKLGHQFDSLGIDTNTVSWKKDISKGAAGLIAISESTKKDMIDYLGIAPERIHVVYLSSSMKVEVNHLASNKINEKPYLLYVGNRNIYKNFIPFLIAVSPILKQYNLRLICAGGTSFNEEEYGIIKSLGVEVNIEQRLITDQVLVQLYSHAVAFIFPSLYEGFGIPTLEAMSCGCPCILSDRSSMPEVAGEAALYFNPDDIDDMRSTIVELLDDKKLREKLVERGTKRASLFSWERTVQETLSLYTNIVSMKNSHS